MATFRRNHHRSNTAGKGRMLIWIIAMLATLLLLFYWLRLFAAPLHP